MSDAMELVDRGLKKMLGNRDKEINVESKIEKYFGFSKKE